MDRNILDGAILPSLDQQAQFAMDVFTVPHQRAFHDLPRIRRATPLLRYEFQEGIRVRRVNPADDGPVLVDAAQVVCQEIRATSA
uniref:Uncharacterized protein n=1 Tax=Ralstonia solanacearum TaxID=305 RepID=A0A8D5EX03_RALSL|nr:hypothetical protein 8 [Ralstonia solanacearum]